MSQAHSSTVDLQPQEIYPSVSDRFFFEAPLLNGGASLFVELAS
jgi:hypothetical protein